MVMPTFQLDVIQTEPLQKIDGKLMLFFYRIHLYSAIYGNTWSIPAVDELRTLHTGQNCLKCSKNIRHADSALSQKFSRLPRRPAVENRGHNTSRQQLEIIRVHHL